MSGNFQFEITPILNLEQVRASIKEAEVLIKELRVQNSNFAEAATNPITKGVGGVQAQAAADANAVQAEIKAAVAQHIRLLEQADNLNYASGEAALRSQRAEQVRVFASSDEIIAANAELALSKRQEAAATQVAINNRLLGAEAGSEDANLLLREAQARVQAKVIAANEKLADLAVIEAEGRQEYIGLLSQSAEQQALLAAEIAAATENLKAGDADYAAAQATLIRAKVEQAIAVQVATGEQDAAALGSGGQSVAQLNATVAYGKQVASLEQRVALNKLLLEGDQEAITLQAEANVLQAQINAIRKEQEAVGLRNAGLAVPGETGSNGSSVGVLGGGLGGLAKFALGAAAFVTVAKGVTETLKEASALQTQFSILQTQLVATDRAGDFPILKAGLFAIGKQVGVETSQLAQLAVQITGAFQNEQGARGTPQFALDQVRAAAEIQKLYGLSNAEIANGVTALAYTFDTTFQKIGDKAAGLQARFGVTSRELITSISQIAPVAKAMGLSFDQLSVISASAERETGRTGVSVTEALGRVLPNIAQHTEDVLAAYQGNAALANSYNKIVQDIASGESGKVLIQLIKDWDKFGQVQRDALLSSLGGGRQAPQLAAVFGDPQLIKELNNPINDTGKLNEQFSKLQNTIGQVFDRFKQSLIQIGVALGEAGILPALKDIVNILEVFTSLLAPLIGLLGNFKEALNIGGVDVFSKLVEGLLVLKGLQLGRGLFTAGAAGAGPGGTGLSGGLGNLLTFGLLKNRGGGASAGTAAAEASVVDSTKSYASGFYGAFIQRVNNFIHSPGAIATAGLGVAGVVAGQVVGGEAGKTLTALGSGLTAGAVTGSPLLGVVVAGGQILENFLSSAKDAQAKEAALRQKYASLSDAKLQEIASKPGTGGYKVNPGGFQGFAGNYLNTLSLGATNIQVGDSKSDIAGAEYQERTRQRFQRYAETIQRLTSDPKLAKQVQKELNSNPNFDELTKFVLELFKKINNGTIQGLNVYKIFKEGNNKALNRFRGALASGDQEAAGDAGQSLLDQTKQNYTSGNISGQTYINQLETRRNGLFGVLSANGAGQKNVVDKINKYDAEIGAYYSDQIKRRLDALRTIREAQGLDIPEADIDASIAALHSVHFTDPSARAQVVAQVFKDLKTILQREVDGAATAAEKLAIEQRGIEVPVDVKIAAIQPLLDAALQESNLNVKKLEVAVESAGFGNLQQFEQNVIGLAEYLGISVYQAMKLLLEKILTDTNQEVISLTFTALSHAKWNKALENQLNTAVSTASEIAKQLQNLESQANTSLQEFQFPEIGNVHLGNDAALANQAAQEAQTAAEAAAREALAEAKARGDILKALAERDPVASALADIAAANLDYQYATKESERLQAIAAQIRAQHAYEDALNAITKAQGDVLSAMVSNNPVLAARAQIIQADEAAAEAVGEAAKLEALAQQISAQRALQQAIFDAMKSAVDVVIAISNFAGNAVKAAQLSLFELQAQLQFQQSQHAGDAAINATRAAIINQQAALRDAQLKDKEDTIDFNLQTHNISTAQAVAQYQALLSNADILQLTTQERRDLILKIQQLKGDLQKDLQFDLPTDLALPTLYEARRIGQSGGNYQDNRQVTITLNSTDPASTEAAVTRISDLLNEPPVISGSGRIY